LELKEKWTKCIKATFSSSASKQVVGEEIEEMEVLEDENFKQAMLGQRGDTQYTYKVSA